MDLIHRKTRYQEFLSKIHKVESQLSSKGDNRAIYESMQEEVNSIIESMRNRGDQSNAKIHFVILIVLLVIVLVWHSVIYHAYLSNAIILVVMGIALLLAQYRMTQVIKISQSNAPNAYSGSENIKAFIMTKMRYLDTAMDIKKARLLLVALFYMIFCPVLLVKLHEVALGSTPFDSNSVAYLIAYLLAGGLWFVYFNRSFEVYDDITETMDHISDRLKTLD